jgi:Asp/Glu/hydantoin racemase
MRIWHQSFSDLDRAPAYRQTLADHAGRVLEPGIHVRLHGLAPGTYGERYAPIHAIRYRYLEALNEAQICEAALVAQREGYDAFALGCFHDPALREARSLVDIPVVGLSETCLLVACSLARRFALVTLNRDQQVQHEDLAAAYGLASRVAAVIPMHPGIDEYMLEADDETSAPIVEGFRAACRKAIAAGAELIIPGDGFLNEFLYRRRFVAFEGAPVMDALGVLFHHAAFMARMQSSLGLRPSRLHHYATPPPDVLLQARAAAGRREWTEDDFSGASSRGQGSE